MAGPLVLLSEFTEKTKSAIGDQWEEVHYSRFFNYPHPSLSSTHPSLTPIRASYKSRHKGYWISSSSTASLNLTPDRIRSGFVLTVALLGKIYEEHYISKLHFSWPHVSCVAGFPTRGTRVVFVCYRDCLDQIQKFALRFSTSCETETFINALKEIMGGRRDARLPCGNFASGISLQSEFVPSDETPYRDPLTDLYNIRRPKQDCQDWNSVDTYTDQMQSGLNYGVVQSTNSQDTELNCDTECISGTSAMPSGFTSLLMSSYSDADQPRGNFLSEILSQPKCVASDDSAYRPKLDWISVDTSTDQMQSSSNYKVAQNSCSQDTVLKPDTDSIFGSLPPSFASLVMSCLPVAEQDGARKPISGDTDLENQIARCLQDPSFNDMLIKVERVMSEIGVNLEL